jgi:leucyl/phenylalanyl-tRNA--protein transferase
VRQGRFELRCDTAFAETMLACAAATEKRPNTWINDEILRLYGALFRMDHAHSVECWRDEALVGGLYGVSLGGVFFGESMFSRETDASKVALVHLVAILRAGGYRLLDVQFQTPHLARFGTIEIARAVYRRRLADALRYRGDFRAGVVGAGVGAGGTGGGGGASQSSTLTS